MKLLYESWQVEIEVKGINNICIENPNLWRKVLLDLKNQSNGMGGGFSLFEGTKEISFSKNLSLIETPLIMDFSNKKLQTSLYKQMESVILDLYQGEYSQLERALYNLLFEVSTSLDVDVEINLESDKSTLFKSMGVNLVNSDQNDLVEGMYSYISTLSYFLNMKCFILIQIRDLFTDDEWGQFVKEMNIKGISIINFETRTDRLETREEKRYIIDKDLCEIY